jgi:hypothetical protein
MERNLQHLLFVILVKKRLSRNKEEKKKIERRIWTRQIFLERKQKGEFHHLVQETKLFDNEYFYKQFRMSPTTFEKLLCWVAPHINKKDTHMREAISAEERLCVTLRYLASGNAQVSIATSYRIAPSTVSSIIKETTPVIWMVLLEQGYINPPNLEEEWVDIASEFDLQWDFPNCLGAIDGKHVTIQAPANSGSKYFNYKKSFSIVLMAVCDANYRFTLVDVGEAGRQSDGGVFSNSNLGYSINNKTLNFPGPKKIKNSMETFPYTFIGDEAFALKDNLLKPYASASLNQERRVFNYRLSRARRTIENAFGILASVFRIFRRPINANVETVRSITKATVALHNFLLTEKSEKGNFKKVKEEWRTTVANDGSLLPVLQTGSNNYSKDAKTVRDEFCKYFNSVEGSVPWQMEMI